MLRATPSKSYGSTAVNRTFKGGDSKINGFPPAAIVMENSKVLIVGLGNPLLGDDRIGWCVAEQLTAALPEQVEVDCLSVGGLGLMERLIGYDVAILVDAITTGQNPVGTVTCFPLEELPDRAAGHLSSAHDMTLQTALQFGRKLGAQLPDKIRIVAIESACTLDFSEELSPLVADAIPRAVRVVLNELAQEGCLIT
jgi:hydrogenase maturation protease